MQEIRKKMGWLVLTTGGGLLLSLSLFTGVNRQPDKDLFLAVAIPVLLATILSGLLLVREYGNYRLARLITENSFLHIQAAGIEELPPDGEGAAGPIGGIDIIISCFGILLDSQVIKFNLDGVSLKTVEIGDRCICLSYAAKDRIRRVRVLHGGIGDQEGRDLIGRFHYETGVMPTVIIEK